MMLRPSEMFIKLPCRRISQTYAVKTSRTKLVAAPTSRQYNICRSFSNTSASDDKFLNQQPPSRLGICHPSLTSYLSATGNNITNDAKEVESSTLIILTNINERKLLLGKKLRGFGTGKYNGFGGRLEREETPAHCAKRELMEEANLSIDLDEFVKGSVGKLSFTFQDREHIEMLVHLFHINVQFRNATHNTCKGTIIDPDAIRACDEMIPEWFDWGEIPLHQMFADDSIWLTYYLSSLDARRDKRSHASLPKMNGWFHFAPGGDGNNQILHYFLDT